MGTGHTKTFSIQERDSLAREMDDAVIANCNPVPLPLWIINKDPLIAQRGKEPAVQRRGTNLH